MAEKTDALCQQLQEAEALAEASDWTAAQSILESSYQAWSEWQSYLRMVAQHSEAAEAEALYVRALALAQSQESGELRTELAELRGRLRLLAETERCSLQNIL